MWAQTYLSKLFSRDGDPGLINGRVQIGLTTKISGRSRGPNKIEDCLVTIQGVASPVGTNQIEHAMLNQVPFGSTRGIMGHRDNQTELIGQTLQADFPEPPPMTIRATPIRLDQKVGFTRIKATPQFQPPSPDGGHGKLGSIMRRTDHDVTLVMADVIDPIGDGFALGRVQKVIDIHVTPLLSPLHSRLLKVADQLTLFGINTDDGPTAAQISLSPAHDVAKLLIPMRRLLASEPFVIDPQRIISGLQQATNRWQTDQIFRRQGFLDFAQRFVGPFQTRDGVTRRFFSQQRFQSDQQIGYFFSVRGRPPPLALIRSLKSLAIISP